MTYLPTWCKWKAPSDRWIIFYLGLTNSPINSFVEFTGVDNRPRGREQAHHPYNLFQSNSLLLVFWQLQLSDNKSQLLVESNVALNAIVCKNSYQFTGAMLWWMEDNSVEIHFRVTPLLSVFCKQCRGWSGYQRGACKYFVTTFVDGILKINKQIIWIYVHRN